MWLRRQQSHQSPLPAHNCRSRAGCCCSFAYSLVFFRWNAPSFPHSISCGRSRHCFLITFAHILFSVWFVSLYYLILIVAHFCCHLHLFALALHFFSPTHRHSFVSFCFFFLFFSSSKNSNGFADALFKVNGKNGDKNRLRNLHNELGLNGDCSVMPPHLDFIASHRHNTLKSTYRRQVQPTKKKEREKFGENLNDEGVCLCETAVSRRTQRKYVFYRFFFFSFF